MAARKTLKIKVTTHRQLKSMARQMGKVMEFIVEEALQDLLRKHRPKQVLRKDHDEE